MSQLVLSSPDRPGFRFRKGRGVSLALRFSDGPLDSRHQSVRATLPHDDGSETSRELGDAHQSSSIWHDARNPPNYAARAETTVPCISDAGRYLISAVCREESCSVPEA